MKFIPDLFLFDYKSSDDIEKLPNGQAVIATVEGYVTFTNKVNRNNRFYPPGFWERVLTNDEALKEMIDTKTFFGETKHPGKEDSPFPQYEKISHAIRSFKVDDVGVYAVFDILDTALGRLIKTFIDYGSKLGVSTRAFGEQKEDKEKRMVPVESKYKFVTWDFVVFPAYSEARMTKVFDDLEVSEEDFNFDSFKLSVSKEDFIKKISLMDSQSDAKLLCDFVGVEYTPKEDDKVKELRDSLDEAVTRIQSLEEKKPNLPPPVYDDSWLRKLLTDKTHNDWDKVDLSIDGNNTEIEELRIELKEVYDSFVSLQNDYNIVSLQLDTKSVEDSEELIVQKAKIKKLQDQLESFKSVIKSKVDEIKEAQSIVDSAQQEITRLEEINDELVDTANEVIEEYNNSINLNNTLKAQLDETEKLVSEQVSDKTDLSATVSKSASFRPLVDVESMKGVPVFDEETEGINRVFKKLKKGKQNV